MLFSFLFSVARLWLVTQQTSPSFLSRIKARQSIHLSCCHPGPIPHLLWEQVKQHGSFQGPRGSLPQEPRPGEGTLGQDGLRAVLRGYWLHGWVLSHTLRGSLTSPAPPQLPGEVSCDKVPATTQPNTFMEDSPQAEITGCFR